MVERANVERRPAWSFALACCVALLCVVHDASAESPEGPRLLSFYERSYFVSSLDATDSVKFQFSIKYAVWPFDDEASDTGEPYAPREGIFFGYTQLAIWDAYDIADSSR